MPDRRIVTVLGTRPEAIKLLPVQRLLEETPGIDACIVHTGQHRELVDQVLAPFGIAPSADLRLMKNGQPLSVLAAEALAALDRMFASLHPDLVLAQGDTTSAMAAALAAFHRGIPVAHVEAGLRSGDLAAPFPEEANRRIITQVAALHFAPTSAARENLLGEGVDDRTIVLTGNTAIDALLLALDRLEPAARRDPAPSRRVLVTLHRRESWHVAGDDPDAPCPLDGVLDAIRDVASARPGISVLFPVHPNPRVRRRVERRLGGLAGIDLIEPLAYVPFVHAMANADVIVSDSGGVQEEAPSLGVPVLVVRERTERPEGLQPGMNRLVGLDRHAVREALENALSAPRVRPSRLPVDNPFGDGRAAQRIVEALQRFWRTGRPRSAAPSDRKRAPARKATRRRVAGGESR